MAEQNDNCASDPESLSRSMVAHTNSLPPSEFELLPPAPPRGIKHSQSLRVKRDTGQANDDNGLSSSKGWSFGNMARALSSGVVQGTIAVGSGVVQGSMAVGSGVVHGSKMVGSGVVHGTKVVGTGVVQGTMAAGRMTKDVTIAAGKGVYHAGEVVGSAAVTGVSAASEATVTAGRVVTSASVSAVMDTTKWMREQSESFGMDDLDFNKHLVLPGETLETVAGHHGLAVNDLIRANQLQRRALRPGQSLILPDVSKRLPPHPDEVYVAKSSYCSPCAEEMAGFVRFTTQTFCFSSYRVSDSPFKVDVDAKQVELISLDVCALDQEPMPDLMPAEDADQDPASVLVETPSPASSSSTSTPLPSVSSGERLEEDDDSQARQECVLVEVSLRAENAHGETSAAAEAPPADPEAEAVMMKVVMSSTDSVQPPHLALRFPLSDVAPLAAYLQLWHPDKLSLSDSFQQHLALETSGLTEEEASWLESSGPSMSEESSLLKPHQVRQIFRNLPHKIQSQPWVLAYSTRMSGFSLQNLYRTVADDKEPFLMVIQDTTGYIFGAFLTCKPCISDNFIGTGKSWLFSFGQPSGQDTKEDDDEDEEDQDVAAADDSQEAAVREAYRLHVFHWSGSNEYFFKGHAESVMIGASDGRFGIVVDGDLHQGRIQACDTFEGWPHRSKDFLVSCLELWRFH